VEGADVAPRPVLVSAVAGLERALVTAERRWRAAVQVSLPALNARLRRAGLAPVAAP